jgi:hypothetical protein
VFRTAPWEGNKWLGKLAFSLNKTHNDLRDSELTALVRADICLPGALIPTAEEQIWAETPDEHEGVLAKIPLELLDEVNRRCGTLDASHYVRILMRKHLATLPDLTPEDKFQPTAGTVRTAAEIAKLQELRDAAKAAGAPAKTLQRRQAPEQPPLTPGTADMPPVFGESEFREGHRIPRYNGPPQRPFDSEEWRAKAFPNFQRTSVEKGDFDVMITEWEYRGKSEDRGAYVTCESCDFQRCRYVSLIHNVYNKNELWVGSHCIEQGFKDRERAIKDIDDLRRAAAPLSPPPGDNVSDPVVPALPPEVPVAAPVTPAPAPTKRPVALDTGWFQPPPRHQIGNHIGEHVGAVWKVWAEDGQPGVRSQEAGGTASDAAAAKAEVDALLTYRSKVR